MYGSLSSSLEREKRGSEGGGGTLARFLVVALAAGSGLLAIHVRSTTTELDVEFAPSGSDVGSARAAIQLAELASPPDARNLSSEDEASSKAVDGPCVANSWDSVPSTGGKKIYQLTAQCLADFTCAAGSYCPAGSFTASTEAEALTYFQATWWPASGVEGITCEVIQGTAPDLWAYQCKCGNGFWCPTNTALPRFCPKEFVCKRPADIEKCPADKYCKEGSVHPRTCTWAQDCPKGSSAPTGSASGIVWFVVITFVSYCIFAVWFKFKEERDTKGNKELEDYREVIDSRRDASERDANGATGVAVPVSSSADKEDGFLIEFEDIRLVLPDGTTIMRGPSGKFKPGTSTAIMGASGAGKTTIMNLVTGKVKKTSGTIKCNGEACESLAKWKNRIAFVPQEDVMHRQLTVLENITFSALTRLPANWTAEQKREKIMDVLYVLNLTKIQHSKIGDEFERGVSGGQRKRVNVGLELVSDPKVLFLDEPTSGLDSVSATELSQMLRDIAERDRLTVAAVIHSPGPAAFDAFSDYLLLQTGGRLVYAGETRGVTDYFAEIGFKYPAGETLDPIADYVMKCVAGGVKPDKSAAIKVKGEWDHMTGFTKLWHLKNGLPPPEDDEGERDTPSAAGAAKALLCQALKGLAMYPVHCLRACFPQRIRDKERPTVGFFATFGLCFGRACRQQYRGFFSFALSCIVLYFAVGQFLTGLMGSDLNVLGGYSADICAQQYPQLQDACLSLQQNDYLPALGSIIFIIVAMAAASSASTFGCETAQYWREASAGLSTPAYFLAKVCADVPLCLVSAFAIWASFISGFYSPMEDGQLLGGFILINAFGYLSGYFLSFLLPYSACGLVGVVWAVWWGLLYSGTGGQLPSENREQRWLYAASGPRWFMEGVFYSTTVYPFEKVRAGPSKGEPYYDVSRAKQDYLFFNTYSFSMGMLAIVCIVMLVIDLWLITTTKLAKKM